VTCDKGHVNLVVTAHCNLKDGADYDAPGKNVEKRETCLMHNKSLSKINEKGTEKEEERTVWSVLSRFGKRYTKKLDW
jgi:hypothetical protein